MRPQAVAHQKKRKGLRARGRSTLNRGDIIEIIIEALDPLSCAFALSHPSQIKADDFGPLPNG